MVFLSKLIVADSVSDLLNLIPSFIWSFIVGRHERIQEIAHTPFSSLNLSVVGELLLYLIIVSTISRLIWFTFSALNELEELPFESQEKKEEQRKLEEERYSGGYQRKFLDCVAAMESEDSLIQLRALYLKAVSDWPKWEWHLFTVYNKRKKVLLNNK
ncbi:hypothetical protein N9Y92_04210 [Chlamydiales bacterium]|nr:hypothetical protein [Chlamydiales bacterium]